MDDVRFQKVEAQLARHTRKLSDHESKHALQEELNMATISGMESLKNLVLATQESVKAHQLNTAAAIDLTAQMTHLGEALGILGKIAKWVLAVSAFSALMVTWIKAYLHWGE